MKTSLRQKLNDLIKLRGQIDYNSLKAMVEGGSFGRRYRMETATRRLRNESPDVQAVEENGAIVSYKWVGTPIVFKEFRVLDEKGNVEKIIKVAG